MANLDDLYDVDERFRAIEDHQRGTLVSSAGPGTGKTHSFLRRAAALVESGRAEPNAVCYLTFIKEITRAFLTDYNTMFGPQLDPNLRPRVSTLHSFACRIIRNRGFTVGYDGPLYFSGLSEPSNQPAAIFLADLLPFVAELGITSVPRLAQAMETIKYCWRNNADPSALPAPLPSVLHACLVLANSYRLIDWDHAVNLAHSLYLVPENRQRWLAQLQHFFIDEYQDFNPSEQHFLHAIGQAATSVVIVGDPNQSIYRRRSASPDALRSLLGSERVDQISLLRCRRCAENILQASNLFLRYIDAGRQPLLSHRAGGLIACYRFKSTKAELAFLRVHLRELLASMPADPTPQDSVACLFPSRKILSFYLDSLKDAVPSYAHSTQVEPNRATLALHLQLICSPGQRLLQRLVIQSWDEIKPRHERQMVRLVLLRDLSPSQALSVLLNDGSLKGVPATAARSFMDYCAALESADADTIADAISVRLGYDRSLLRDCARDFLLQLPEADQDDAIDYFCDRVLPDTAEPPEDPHAIQFLTIHAAKGLTRRGIVMPGLEDSWLPGQAAGDDLDERRRLFYVAITRATSHVLITYPATRARGDPLNYPSEGRGEPSRFIALAGIPHSYHE